MTKILMITGLGAVEGLVRGQQNALFETLKEYHKYWERIDIICPKLTIDRQPLTTNYFGNVFIHVSSVPLLFYPFYFVWKAVRLHKRERFCGMTVQDFPPFYNGIGARIVRFLTQLPYVVEIMHIPGYPRSSGLKEKIYYLLARWFIRFDVASAVAVRIINRTETGQLLKRFGVPEEKLRYIPATYIDLDIFKPSDVKKKYDAIFVGRLEENKGIDLFLEAVHLANCSAVIVGTGPLLVAAKSKAANYNLRAVFYGWAKDSAEIAGLLNQSRILVMSSYNEGGPRVVIEAMACGVPVAATPVGIVPDVIHDGQTGRIVYWQAEHIAMTVREVLSDAAIYEKCRVGGLEIAGRFEKKQMIRNYAEEIKKLICR